MYEKFRKEKSKFIGIYLIFLKFLKDVANKTKIEKKKFTKIKIIKKNFKFFFC